MQRLRDWFAGIRDALVSDPRFHRATLTFPLSRPIVISQSRALFSVVSGFVSAQTLFALVQLDAFATLKTGPKTTADLAQRFAMPEHSVDVLMKSAQAIGLAEQRLDGWGLTLTGAAMAGQHGVAAMVSHHDRFYADLADPVALLRGERASALAGYWSYAAGYGGSGHQEDSAGYSALMAASQSFIGPAILHNRVFRQARTLVDVGGGAGAFAVEALKRHAQLTVTVCDRADVVPLATSAFESAGFANRTTVQAADFFADPLPTGDVVTLVRILHDHDDDAVRRLLSNVAGSLGSSTLAIIEPMAHPSKPTGFDAYFPWYFKAMGQGRLRTRDETKAHLTACGFRNFKRLHSRNPTLVEGLTATL